MATNNKLGKGLGALISATARRYDPTAPQTTEDAGDNRANATIRLEEVVASPMQPRRVFREEPLDGLMESIRNHGLIQPLVVRKVGGKYELIAGERRFRAMQKMGLTEAPVRIIDATDRDVLEMALVENLQREDLNPIEEAEAYCRLAVEFSMKQEEIAGRVGKNRATVANSMRLMELADDVKAHLAHSRITTGHAKAILGIRDPAMQSVVADMVVRQKLTVRQTEKHVQEQLDREHKPLKETDKPTGEKKKTLDASLARLQSRLRDHFGTHVSLQHGGKKGRLEIEYYGNEDLSRILLLLGIAID